MSNMYRIVVGVDFAESGDEALRMAIELGRVLPRPELHITAVVVDKNSPTAQRLAEDERRLRDTADKLTEYVKARCASDHAPFELQVVQHVRLGDAAKALHQVAVDVDADLIVVGSKGTQGIARWVLGSVSEALMKQARCPVLVAKPNELGSLPKTERPLPPHPGQTEADLHAPSSIERRMTLSFGGTPHVAGNI